jgi:hypothetical protein
LFRSEVDYCVADKRVYGSRVSCKEWQEASLVGNECENVGGDDERIWCGFSPAL